MMDSDNEKNNEDDFYMRADHLAAVDVNVEQPDDEGSTPKNTIKCVGVCIITSCFVSLYYTYLAIGYLINGADEKMCILESNVSERPIVKEDISLNYGVNVTDQLYWHINILALLGIVCIICLVKIMAFKS